jgi:hypothetical protein
MGLSKTQRQAGSGAVSSAIRQKKDAAAAAKEAAAAKASSPSRCANAGKMVKRCATALLPIVLAYVFAQSGGATLVFPHFYSQVTKAQTQLQTDATLMCYWTREIVAYEVAQSTLTDAYVDDLFDGAACASLPAWHRSLLAFAPTRRLIAQGMHRGATHEALLRRRWVAHVMNGIVVDANIAKRKALSPKQNAEFVKKVSANSVPGDMDQEAPLMLQVVDIGGGHSSLALRLPHLFRAHDADGADAVRVFEVDGVDVAAAKQRRLDAAVANPAFAASLRARVDALVQGNPVLAAKSMDVKDKKDKSGDKDKEGDDKEEDAATLVADVVQRVAYVGTDDADFSAALVDAGFDAMKPAVFVWERQASLMNVDEARARLKAFQKLAAPGTLLLMGLWDTGDAKKVDEQAALLPPTRFGISGGEAELRKVLEEFDMVVLRRDCSDQPMRLLTTYFEPTSVARLVQHRNVRGRQTKHERIIAQAIDNTPLPKVHYGMIGFRRFVKLTDGSSE